LYIIAFIIVLCLLVTFINGRLSYLSYKGLVCILFTNCSHIVYFSILLEYLDHEDHCMAMP